MSDRASSPYSAEAHAEVDAIVADIEARLDAELAGLEGEAYARKCAEFGREHADRDPVLRFQKRIVGALFRTPEKAPDLLAEVQQIARTAESAEMSMAAYILIEQIQAHYSTYLRPSNLHATP